jgi:hypothetical protein
MSGIFDQIINYSPPLIVSGTVNYKGTWNASTNNPTLNNPPAASTKGDYYVVSTAGTQFSITFGVGDWIISNGTAWEKVDLTDAVHSVFGRTGAVVGDSTDYSAVGLTNTAIGASSPSTGAFTSLSSSSTTTLNGTTVPASKTLVVTTDKLSALAATTSAELAGVISDETGSGALVFATSPTLVTPALGTPSSGTVTNLTGTASININGTVGATTPTTGVFTGLTVNDNTTLGSSNSDTVNFNARVASDLNPSTDDTYDLGIVGHEWRNLRIDGTANIDSLVADSADINGGTIDGTAIGGSTAAAGAFTTVTASDTVGVGATLAAWLSTRKVVQMGLGAQINGSTSLAPFAEMGANFYLDSGIVSRYLTTNVSTNYRQVNGSHVFQTAASGTAGDAITFTDRATITSTGLNSTAIGATTPSTGAFTTVALSDKITATKSGSNADYDVLTARNANAGNDSSTRILLGQDSSSVAGFVQMCGSGHATTPNVFRYGTNISGTSIQAVINTSTITTTSSTGLAVTGTLSSTTTLQAKQSTTNPASTGALPGLSMGFDAGGEVSWIQSERNSLAETRALLLNPNGGNVGIGTTSPGSKLDVNGELRIGNTVNTVSPTSPNRTVTIVIGGTTYYLAAKTTND